MARRSTNDWLTRISLPGARWNRIALLACIFAMMFSYGMATGRRLQMFLAGAVFMLTLTDIYLFSTLKALQDRYRELYKEMEERGNDET